MKRIHSDILYALVRLYFHNLNLVSLLDEDNGRRNKTLRKTKGNSFLCMKQCSMFGI